MEFMYLTPSIMLGWKDLKKNMKFEFSFIVKLHLKLLFQLFKILLTPSHEKSTVVYMHILSSLYTRTSATPSKGVRSS